MKPAVIVGMLFCVIAALSFGGMKQASATKHASQMMFFEEEIMTSGSEFFLYSLEETPLKACRTAQWMMHHLYIPNTNQHEKAMEMVETSDQIGVFSPGLKVILLKEKRLNAKEKEAKANFLDRLGRFKPTIFEICTLNDFVQRNVWDKQAPKVRKDALHILMALANIGYADAQTLTYWVLLDKVTMEKDPEKQQKLFQTAMGFLKQAVDQNDVRALWSYAAMWRDYQKNYLLSLKYYFITEKHEAFKAVLSSQELKKFENDKNRVALRLTPQQIKTASTFSEKESRELSKIHPMTITDFLKQ